MPKLKKGSAIDPHQFDATGIKEFLVATIVARYGSVYAFARHTDAITVCNLTGVKPTTIESSLGKACTSLPILSKISEGLLGKPLTKKSVTTVTVVFTLG